VKFQKVHIEVSNACNLRCSFCPEVVRPKRLMEPDFFREVLRQVAPLAEQVALHLMGDPLVHPRLGELVKICEQEGARVFLVTNGTLLREETGSLLLRPPFRQVNFSLHSFSNNFPERDPTEYLDRIFDWTERAFRERPDLYINYRLWNLENPQAAGAGNFDFMGRIRQRFGAEGGVPGDVRRRKNLLLKNRLYLHFDTEFVWPDLSLPELGAQGTCHGLSSHFGVLVDGTVVPCCLDKEGAIPLGNIRERGLGEILGGARAQQILKGFKERRLVEDLCRRCQYIERFGR
jgi:radical SAM protein with 4Fe4S-binding SPASM domain